jgi:hypothetical protein
MRRAAPGAVLSRGGAGSTAAAVDEEAGEEEEELGCIALSISVSVGKVASGKTVIHLDTRQIVAVIYHDYNLFVLRAWVGQEVSVGAGKGIRRL